MRDIVEQTRAGVPGKLEITEEGLPRYEEERPNGGLAAPPCQLPKGMSFGPAMRRVSGWVST
ncbi:hypothetical protein DSC45_00190 [Streptomyces sp. YIM 130001]|nr:hypothetical protein DSC45_00190 [Streptomyces sp. YIM 130001]